METQKNKNSISITNKSKHNLTIIVEYIHWVEELAPGKMFTIEVETAPEINALSLYDLDYGEQCITVLLNNDIDHARKYTVRFFIDNDCLGEMIL